MLDSRIRAVRKYRVLLIPKTILRNLHFAALHSDLILSDLPSFMTIWLGKGGTYIDLKTESFVLRLNQIPKNAAANSARNTSTAINKAFVNLRVCYHHREGTRDTRPSRLFSWTTPTCAG